MSKNKNTIIKFFEKILIDHSIDHKESLKFENKHYYKINKGLAYQLCKLTTQMENDFQEIENRIEKKSKEKDENSDDENDNSDEENENSDDENENKSQEEESQDDIDMNDENPEKELIQLNCLGQLYHSYFGLHPEKNGNIEIETDQIPLKMSKKVFRDGKYNESGLFIVPYSSVTELAKKELPFENIVIKYSKDTWYSKPDNWFNKPSKWWNNYNKYLEPYVLPYLNTRKHIHIDNPFMQITLCN